MYVNADRGGSKGGGGPIKEDTIEQSTRGKNVLWGKNERGKEGSFESDQHEIVH